MEANVWLPNMRGRNKRIMICTRTSFPNFFVGWRIFLKIALWFCPPRLPANLSLSEVQIKKEKCLKCFCIYISGEIMTDIWCWCLINGDLPFQNLLNVCQPCRQTKRKNLWAQSTSPVCKIYFWPKVTDTAPLTPKKHWLVIAAKDLTAKSGGTADPYVIVKWGKKSHKTAVKKKVRLHLGPKPNNFSLIA